jgi:hypothetical protein
VTFLLALILAMSQPEPQLDPKLAWGLDECHSIAEKANYDDCTVWLSLDRVSMTLTYHCAEWDAEKERWMLPEGPVVQYQWTDVGPKRLNEPLMIGCPETV